MTMAAPTDADGQAVTFFNIAKQIPKGVKRHCGMCRQHGVVAQTRNHACPFKACDCAKCNLVRQRRSIMSMQIRLRREQDKMFVRTAEPDQAEIVPPTKASEAHAACYFCQKCKNHGVLKWKKDHKKNCEFANCNCGQCELIDTRRALDSHIKKGKKRQHQDDEKMEVEETDHCSLSIASSSPSASDGRTPSLADIEFSASLSALGYGQLPEASSSSAAAAPETTTTFLTTVSPSSSMIMPAAAAAPAAPTPPTLLSTELLLQQLALQAASLSLPQQQTTVALPQHTVVSPITVPAQFAMPQQQQNSPVHYLIQQHVTPTILIQNPVLFALPQTTVPQAAGVPQLRADSLIPQLAQIDFSSLVNNVRGMEQLFMLNARV